MSPIVANTIYRARCDLCGAPDWFMGASRESVERALGRWWLVAGPLTICDRHGDLEECPCGATGQMWAGNCADCWRRAMELPRGTCDRDAAQDALVITEAMWCQPPRRRAIHGCVQLLDSRGSHPGPHQCLCGAVWGQR